MPSRTSWLYLIALALAWLGYFSPWLWPAPVALRLSAHDLVEWMTFVQTVRDGTYPVTRLDLLWPLAGLALLSALSISHFGGPAQASPPSSLRWVLLRPLHLGCLALALFASYLILPAYPFLITAYRDPELAPQFWLGVASATAALPVSIFAAFRPAWANSLAAAISLFSLITSVRASLIIRQPLGEVLTHPPPAGYGLVLTVAGFAALALLPGIGLGRSVWKRVGRRVSLAP